MKKLISFSCLLVLAILSSASGQTWRTVGTAGFSAGQADYTKIALDPSGTPYVAYSDGGNGNRATVMKFNGTNWVLVGTAGFSAGAATQISIAIDGAGTPYVLYRDGANSTAATVMKFFGGNWVLVGTAGFSVAPVIYTSIAIDGAGTPFVAYSDGGSSYKATVKEFFGGNWVTVGTAGFSVGDVEFISLAIDGSRTPYVAYLDGGINYQPTVMKFNVDHWEAAGNAGISAGEAGNISIAIDGASTPFVAYSDGGNGYRVTVMKFFGGSWVPVGTAGFSMGTPYYTTIAIDSAGTPYVIYSDGGNNSKATVMRYTNGNWEAVGSAGFSAGSASFISAAIDGAGSKYVVYSDYGNGQKATVMRYTLLPVVSTGTVSSMTDIGADCNIEIIVANGYPATSRGICWNSVGSPTISDTNYKENGTFESGTFTGKITGLTLGKTYYARAFAENSNGIGYGNEIVFTLIPPVPQLYTLPVTNIQPGSATCGGHVYYKDNKSIIEYGVCWNKTGNPTVSNDTTKLTGSFAGGSFSANLKNLTLGQKFYVRAYATNSTGTGYGNEMSFTTYNPENVNKISFQGLLTDNTGKLLNDGNYSITFKLYDALTGGTQVWAETQTVAVARGMVNVNLGAVNPIDAVKFNTSYWLGITVGTGSELSPRTAITGSAYPVGSVGK